MKAAQVEIVGGRHQRAALTPIAPPTWLPPDVWGFDTMRLETGGDNLAVTDVGQGPVLLFMHAGLWSFIWRDVMLRLRDDFRCVTFDAPGNGQSDRLPAREVNLERVSRAAAAVIEALDLLDLTLVVHDLAGPAGIAGAAQTPQRVRGLAAVNTFAWKPSGAVFRAMLALMGSAPMREFDAFTGLLARISASTFGAGRISMAVAAPPSAPELAAQASELFTATCAQRADPTRFTNEPPPHWRARSERSRF